MLPLLQVLYLGCGRYLSVLHTKGSLGAVSPPGDRVRGGSRRGERGGAGDSERGIPALHATWTQTWPVRQRTSETARDAKTTSSTSNPRRYSAVFGVLHRIQRAKPERDLHRHHLQGRPELLCELSKFVDQKKKRFDEPRALSSVPHAQPRCGRRGADASAAVALIGQRLPARSSCAKEIAYRAPRNNPASALAQLKCTHKALPALSPTFPLRPAVAHISAHGDLL